MNGTETTFSMFTPPRDRAMQRGLSLTPRLPGPVVLTEKHRPQFFDEIVGQSYAVMKLQSFLDFPHSQAFLFSGATGMGKSSAGFALANELGINRDWNFEWVKSGEMNDDAVNRALKMTRQIGINDGWKMVLCDEADKMTSKANGVWLSALEEICPKTVIVFTTNDPKKLGQRFIDRCEHIKFESDARTLMHDAQILFNRLWIAEGLHGCPPSVEKFWNDIVDEGTLSFRRVVRAVETEMRRQQAAQSGRSPHSGQQSGGPQAGQYREIKAGIAGGPQAEPVVMM